MGVIGSVYLVGAGPGDPDLITVKAIKVLQQVEVVLVDDLVNKALLVHCPQARIINVGKRGGCKSTPQEFINRMLISLAEQGLKVARLKGGDPFLFGRGGEEMLALHAASVPCEIISGVTSGIAVPASLGVPVTHRSFVHGVTLLTGHTQDGDEPNWEALVSSKTTLVIYMGVKPLPGIVQNLLAAGMDSKMPTIAIQHGTLEMARYVKAPLHMLPMAVKQEKLGSPAIIVIGDVVRLARSEELLAAIEVAA
jgi:uroporphyrin-III C-methyltransferase